MIKHNQDGAANPWIISLVLSVVLLIGAIGFGGWAYTERQHYKDDTDAIVAGEVKKAKAQESAAKDRQFAEEAKKPLKIYNGPEALGSLQISYPKTWSGYVDLASNKGSSLLSAYFSPDVVPSAEDKNSVFALRTEVADTTYSQFTQSLAGKVKEGKATAVAYALPKHPKIVGVKIEGEVDQPGRRVTMVALPLRGQTLKVWTDGTQFLSDFNDNILPNFSFTP